MADTNVHCSSDSRPMLQGPCCKTLKFYTHACALNDCVLIKRHVSIIHRRIFHEPLLFAYGSAYYIYRRTCCFDHAKHKCEYNLHANTQVQYRAGTNFLCATVSPPFGEILAMPLGVAVDIEVLSLLSCHVYISLTIFASLLHTHTHIPPSIFMIYPPKLTCKAQAPPTSPLLSLHHHFSPRYPDLVCHI